MLRAFRFIGAGMLAGVLAVPLPAHAQGPPPEATVGGQSVTFLPPAGLWDAEQNTASLLFVTTALSAKAEADARRDGSWPIDGVGPVVKVSLSFVPGRFSAAMDELDRCWIGISGFRSSPIEISGNARDCHLVSTGGRLQPGGMQIGLLEGKGDGYRFRLPFSVMFPVAGTPAPTAAAAPTAARMPAPPVTAAPAVPPNTAAGSGTFSGQTLRFTNGLAWVNGDKVEVALFDHAPKAGMLAELKSGTWGNDGPTATLTFMSRKGELGPASVTYCYISLTFPKGGPLGLNANSATQCGLTAFEGDLKPGGHLVARLAGTAPMRDSAPMTWDLRINLPLPR